MNDFVVKMLCTFVVRREHLIIIALETENHILTIRTSVELKFSLKEKINIFSVAKYNNTKNTLAIIRNHSLCKNILDGFGLQTTLFWYFFSR